MWPCYGVHITVWHSLFVYFVSQCIHWAIPTSARFLLRNPFMQIIVHGHILINLQSTKAIGPCRNVRAIASSPVHPRDAAAPVWSQCVLPLLARTPRPDRTYRRQLPAPSAGALFSCSCTFRCLYRGTCGTRSWDRNSRCLETAAWRRRLAGLPHLWMFLVRVPEQGSHWGCRRTNPALWDGLILFHRVRISCRFHFLGGYRSRLTVQTAVLRLSHRFLSLQVQACWVSCLFWAPRQYLCRDEIQHRVYVRKLTECVLVSRDYSRSTQVHAFGVVCWWQFAI